MQKSIHSPRYRAFLRLLRDTREEAGLSQADLGERLGESQSFISKCERGERRLDIVELHAFCRALGVSFHRFAGQVEKALGR